MWLKTNKNHLCEIYTNKNPVLTSRSTQVVWNDMIKLSLKSYKTDPQAYWSFTYYLLFNEKKLARQYCVYTYYTPSSNIICPSQFPSYLSGLSSFVNILKYICLFFSRFILTKQNFVLKHTRWSIHCTRHTTPICNNHFIKKTISHQTHTCNKKNNTYSFIERCV